MRYVILPQALRNVVPANMNLFIALQKDVALLSFIGPVEIFRQAGVYKSLMANFTPYVGAGIGAAYVNVDNIKFSNPNGASGTQPSTNESSCSVPTSHKTVDRFTVSVASS